MQQSCPDADILDTWKEISRYLNHDIRTLQRWERTRGLPVRRVPGGCKPGVYALRSELDHWRLGGPAQTPSTRQSASPPSPSVAVLPFLNLTASEDDLYFADGLADEIITALSQLPGLRVTARTSSFVFRGKGQDVREIGRILKANVVLEGSVRRSGGHVRVIAQLVDTANGYHLWGERFDRQLDDTFTIQDEIALAIVTALRLRLTPAATTQRTVNSEAYRCWLKGRYHTLRQSPQEVLRSRDLFAQAIAIDPTFARAHLGLAESYWEGAVLGLDRPRGAVSIGRAAVLKSLAIDESLAEAHAMLGVYLAIHDYDWESAGHAFRRGLELGPSASQVRLRYATWMLEPNLRFQESQAQLLAALEIDPLSAVIHAALGHELIFRRDFQQAEKELQLAIDLEPDYWLAHLLFAGSQAFQGRFDLALSICERASNAIGPNPVFQGSIALLHALLGNARRVEELRGLILQSATYVANVPLAWIHLGLGQPERCLDCLETAIKEREPLTVEIHPKPLYDALRPHPRFHALLSTMRLVNASS